MAHRHQTRGPDPDPATSGCHAEWLDPAEPLCAKAGMPERAHPASRWFGSVLMLAFQRDASQMA